MDKFEPVKLKEASIFIDDIIKKELDKQSDISIWRVIYRRFSALLR
jgi:hypothetical protein